MLQIIYEFRKHSKKLKNRSGMFEEAMFLAFSFIRIMPRELYSDVMQKAYNICKFDEKDTPFVALALKLGIPVWTNDRGIIENRGGIWSNNNSRIKRTAKMKLNSAKSNQIKFRSSPHTRQQSFLSS